MTENRQLIVLMHLSQLLDLVTGVVGLIVPLLIWALKKRNNRSRHKWQSDYHFQLTMLLYSLLAFALLIFLGLGILIWMAIGFLCLLFPIINAIRTSSVNTLITLGVFVLLNRFSESNPTLMLTMFVIAP